MYEWTDMAGLAKALSDATKDVRRLRAMLNNKGPAAGEIVACAYSYAGRPDAESNTKGSHMLHQAQKIDESLQSIETNINNMRNQLKAAVAAIDDDEARRKDQRAKLKV